MRKRKESSREPKNDVIPGIERDTGNGDDGDVAACRELTLTNLFRCLKATRKEEEEEEEEKRIKNND